MLQYLDELKALHELKNKTMAETLVLAEPPPSGSEDPEKPLLEESQESDDFERENQSQEDVLRQKQEEDCLAVIQQPMAETVRFTEVSNSASSSEVGQVLCSNTTVEDFAGNYSGELKELSFSIAWRCQKQRRGHGGLCRSTLKRRRSA